MDYILIEDIGNMGYRLIEELGEETGFDLTAADKELFEGLKKALSDIIQLEKAGGENNLEEAKKLRKLANHLKANLRLRHPDWFTRSGKPVPGSP
jgi:hypothetical protein